MTMRGSMRAGSPLTALFVVALLLGGCVGVGGGGGRGFGSFMPQQSSSSRPAPPDDRERFRSIPARDDATADILMASDLYDLYSEILQTYVDPVDPVALLEGALKAIQSAAVERGILPLDSDLVELTPVQAARDPDAVWAQFAIRYETHLQKVVNRMGPWPVGQAAARGMLEALNDPNSTYTDSKTFEAQQRGEAGVGVTLAIGAQNGPPIVREVISRSPAEAAGARLGDLILAVDGSSTSSMTLNESTQAIRGASGSPVRLTIRSPGETGTHDATITRGPLNAPAVIAEARDGIEYVKVRRFQDGVAQSVQDALAESARSGARGWVIDLRSTSSGNIQEVSDLAGLFVGRQIIGGVVTRDSPRPAPLSAQGAQLDPRLPTMVLIDADTGSGGELFAAAVKEYGGATLVGAHTAGRVGLSQPLQLADGSVAQITSVRILTPSGGKLEGVGVEPDYPVEASTEDWIQGRDPQLSRAMALLRDVNAES